MSGRGGKDANGNVKDTQKKTDTGIMISCARCGRFVDKVPKRLEKETVDRLRGQGWAIVFAGMLCPKCVDMEEKREE